MKTVEHLIGEKEILKQNIEDLLKKFYEENPTVQLDIEIKPRQISLDSGGKHNFISCEVNMIL